MKGVVSFPSLVWERQNEEAFAVREQSEHSVNAGRKYEEMRFERVLIDYGDSFRRLAAAYERDRDLQQDLFQEIAVAIWRALPTFRNQCSERTFFYRIAHNRAITHIRDMRFPHGDL